MCVCARINILWRSFGQIVVSRYGRCYGGFFHFPPVRNLSIRYTNGTITIPRPRGTGSVSFGQPVFRRETFVAAYTAARVWPRRFVFVFSSTRTVVSPAPARGV